MATQTNKTTPVTHHSLPETGYIRLKLMLLFIPFSASTIWRKVKEGTFPEPVKLSENITAWKAEEVHEWMDNISCQKNHKEIIQ